VWYLAWRLVLSEISFVQELLGLRRPQQEVPPSGIDFEHSYLKVLNILNASISEQPNVDQHQIHDYRPYSFK
jgi:hypothetical protein